MPSKPHVCVIGAGPSGLTTGKNLRQAGIDSFVIFEKGNRVGGNWVYSPHPGHAGVYRSTRTISSKALSAFEDFPFPASYPVYPSHVQIQSYFEAYAERFHVMDHIRFGTEIIDALPDGADGWRVTLASGAQERFDALFVCNGHHWHPHIPALPGVFQGECIHSHDYRTPEPFADKRILVVGAGNSGCDIAAELSATAREVTLSMRRGYHVVPKFIAGIPSDRIFSLFWWIPRPLLQTLAARIAQTFSPPPDQMPRPDHRIFETHPIINSRICDAIRQGRVHVAPDVTIFHEAEVRFSDGSSRPFDAIVFCTGYAPRFPFFGSDADRYAGRDVSLRLRMFVPDRSDLFFIGLFQPTGAIWPLADLQAKLAANYLAGRGRLPNHTERAANAERLRHAARFLNSPRHWLEVDYHRFRRELRREIQRCAY